jgi:LCP family protein required for cell wall assembly
LLLLAVVGAVMVGGLTVWGVQRFNDISFVDVPGVEPDADATAANWLLVGTDSRAGIDPESPDADAFLGEVVLGERADTIMLARVDSAAKTIDVLSVPRDLWVPIGGDGRFGRINGTVREELVSTLGTVLDVDINHYAEVNFVGFQEVVDSLGGVAVWFGNPARDERSGLHIARTGCHILDGAQSLAFARGRTYEEFVEGEWRLDPTGDLGRIARQRIFLFRSIAAAKGALDLTKLTALDDALTVGGKNLLIEDGASITDLISVARVFASTDRENFVGHALPVEDLRTSGGAQVLQLRSSEAEPVLEIFRRGTVPTVPEVPEGPQLNPDDATGTTEPGGSVAPPGADAQPSSDSQPPSAEAPQYPIEFRDEPGFGRFGYVDAPSPAGTPCR